MQQDLRFLLEQPHVTYEKLGRAMGRVPSGRTLQCFLAGTRDSGLHSRHTHVARKVNTFLETIARRNLWRLPEGFVETKVTQRMLVVIAKTVEPGGIGVITSDAGWAKSMTLPSACGIHPGTVCRRICQHSRRQGPGCIGHPRPPDPTPTGR